MLINLALTLVRCIKWLHLCFNCTWSLSNRIEIEIELKSLKGGRGEKGRRLYGESNLEKVGFEGLFE